jgi:alkylhydroperoxidase family enzyme
MPRVELPSDTTSESEYLSVLEHCPQVAERWSELSTTLRFSGKLRPELKEEVRRSTAAEIGCRFCASFGEPKSEHSDPREALAVRLARTVATDPKLVDDALFAELHEHFSADEIVELVALIAFVVIGGQTFGAVMGIAPASAEYAMAYETWLSGEMAGGVESLSSYA